MGVVSLPRKTVKVQFKSTFLNWQVEKKIKTIGIRSIGKTPRNNLINGHASPDFICSKVRIRMAQIH